MDTRDLILTKLRQAASAASVDGKTNSNDREWFSDYPEAERPRLIETFRERLAALKGELFVVKDELQAARCLSQLLADMKGTGLAQDHELIRRIMQAETTLAQRFELGRATPDNHELAAYQIGLTTAETLVARTGSIVMRGTHAGGRRLSVLPPVHVVIAESRQLVPSLDEALRLVQDGEPDWSYACIITGPSRTADIQKVLVLGAHGPKRLVVILIDR